MPYFLVKVQITLKKDKWTWEEKLHKIFGWNICVCVCVCVCVYVCIYI